MNDDNAQDSPIEAKLKQGAKDVIAKMRELEHRAEQIESDHRKLIYTVIALCAAIIVANIVAVIR